MKRLQDPAEWLPLRPTASNDAAGAAALLDCVGALEQIEEIGTIAALRRRYMAASQTSDPALLPTLRVAIGVLCDLRSQGWTFRVNNGEIEARLPAMEQLTVAESKTFVREGHLIERDSQLALPATMTFLRRMERQRRSTSGGWTSVFSLMRDGFQLAAALERAAALPESADRDQALAAIIQPYTQIVRRGVPCEFTGLDLGDIWRYFRHTWTTAYQSTPGRHLAFLVRDAAAPNHPVIGIGALGSSIVQLSVRDEWIGWSGKEFITRVRDDPSDAWAEWLHRTLDSLMTELYVDDFLDENLVAPGDLVAPQREVIVRLREVGADARSTHRLYPQREHHKRIASAQEVDWAGRARTHLFRSKRANALADLLEIRADLADAGLAQPTGAALASALPNPLAVRALRGILRRVKAAHAGIDMMDITVCGAVAPYNSILGGKLVALLMASPDVVRAYTETYRTARSVIASAMAGRAVVRTPNLVLLGTTSLYGAGSSQYSRVRMPADVAGGIPGTELSYHPLGRTAGFGSYHFSQDTVEAMELVLAQASKGREVNSIFGEGVNPKLRKVRAALSAAGLPADVLLQHRQSRLVYAVPLAENFREVLLGLESCPKYLVPAGPNVTEQFVVFWRKRWLAPRIKRLETLADVARNTLTYPVAHRARVPIPADQGDEDLFQPPAGTMEKFG